MVFCYKKIVELANREGSLKILPNLRYIGVGPMPSQIIRDIPSGRLDQTASNQQPKCESVVLDRRVSAVWNL